MKKLLTFLTLLTLFFTTAGAEEQTITVDFESNSIPAGWTNTNFVIKSNPNSNTSNTNGSYCASTNGKNSAVLSYDTKVLGVKSISVDATKTTTNTNNSLYIQYSSDGETWKDAKSLATTKGKWTTTTYEFGVATDCFVAICWKGTTTERFIDNIIITYEVSTDPPVAPTTAINFNPESGSTVYSGTTVNLSLAVEGGANGIKYTTDGTDPKTNGTEGTSVTLNGNANDVITIKAVPFNTNSNGTTYGTVYTATYTLIEPQATVYRRINNVNDLEVGAKYIILHSPGDESINSNVLAKGTMTNNTRPNVVKEINTTDYSVSVLPTEDIAEFTLGGGENAYTFLCNGKYLSSAASSYLNINGDGTEDDSQWVITFTGNQAYIKAKGQTDTKYISWYNNNNCFNVYQYTNTIYLYKEFQEKAYDVTVTQPEEGGTISASPIGTKVVNAGDKITVTATPATGYELTGWTITGANETEPDANNQITATGNVTITATFSKVDYALTRSSNDLSMGDVKITDADGNILDPQPAAAQAGDVVYFKLTTNYGYQPTSNPVTVTNTTSSTTITVAVPDDESGVYSFTMPAGNVNIAATFQSYHGTLRLAGHFNGNTTWRTGNSGPAFTYDNNSDTYTIDAYFTGIDDNGYNDFFFLTLDGVAKHPKADNGNYYISDLNGGEMPFELSGGDKNNFGCAPGVYHIEINGALTSMKFTKQTPTISFSPVAGDVASGTVVTATSTLTSLISGVKENYDSNADGTVTVGVNTDNGNTWNPSETLSTVGPATVYGKAYIGNISVTGQARYNVEEVEGDEYTLVTDVDDIDENGEYVIVTSNAFDNQYYAFGAISGGTAAQSTDFALVGNKVIVTGESVNVLKMSGNNTDGWSIQQLSDDNYLKNGSSTNISTDNNQPTGTWSITIDENNIAKITFSATTSRSIIYRQNANGFKNYSTNDATGAEYSKVKLYKKGTVTPKVETPTFNPEEGTYTEAQSVAINCATEGATIYYTINGSNPTVQYGTVYTGPINVESTTTIKAIAVKDNYLNSDVATATYTIHTSVIGEGDFTLVESDGDIEADREYIIINSAKDKAASAYANNRFTSTENFELTNNDKTASVESDVKIFILEAGENDGKYYLKDSEGNYYTPATGSGNITQSKTELTVQYSDGYVVITSGTVGSTRQIGYNEQGGQEVFGSFTPNTISPTGNGTLRPIYLYYRGGAAVSKPVINPASKVFTEEFDATITCSTQGATIYYTIDGSDPTTSSAVYSSPIHVDKTMTIKAIAEKDGVTSAIAEAEYKCTMVENIAEYLALPIGTDDIVFKNPVIVQYHYISSSGKSYIYVKDDSGCAYFHQPYETEGTPSITQLENGDVIGAHFYGDKDYDEAVTGVSQYAMFTNLQNFAATGNKALAEPELKTVSDIIATNAAELNNHYITIKKVKLSDLYQALSYGGAKYFDIYDETGTIGQAHIGYNKFNIDYASVVDDTDDFYNITGIFTAYNNLLEFHPTEIFKWAEKEVTLADLCENGEEGKSYKITNNLQGVVAVGTSLWVKDENGQSICKTSPASGDEYFEIELEENTRLAQGDYDQSNWLEVIFPDAATAKSFENSIIEGYSIEGVFNSKTNPKLTLASTAQVTKYGNSDEYAPNYYIAPNFTGSQDCATNEHGHFFFMNPKPQEYAQIVWAIWERTGDGNIGHMVITNNSTQNSHQFTGQFFIDLDLNDENGYKDKTKIPEGGTFNFTAIIRKVESGSSNAPALKAIDNDQSASYMVYPLDLSENSIPTGINTVDVTGKAVKSVKYVNVAGMVSDVPFQGVNIVVTEYSDGSRSTSKILRK